MDKKFQQEIRASDKRIGAALVNLEASERGRSVLALFKEMTKPASGLDTAGMQALVTLTQEFAGGRRDFLYAIRPARA